MAVPTTITDLSATIASNVPAGSDQAFPYVDDYLRAAYGFIRQGDTKAANVASASTVDLGAVVGRFVDVTGTTTITSFGTVAAGIWRVVTFAGALTLTHNATSLILPGGANITTAAGDSMVAESLGSGNWKIHIYMPAAGYPSKGYVDTGLSGKAAVAHTHAWSAITDRNVSEGTNSQDPNSAAYPVILTNHANSPDSSYYWHITTTYYSTSGNVAQIAVQYSDSNRVYARSRYGGTWTSWVRCDLGEGLTRSIGASGYAKIPGAGGLMIQWGTFTRSSATQSVSFPISFPSACIAVVQNDNYSAQIDDSSRAYSITASGFTSGRADSSSFNVNYIALGY